MTPTRLAGIGAFVIGGILLFAIGLFLIGERRMLFQKKFTVYTEFSRISGLQPGASVKVNGMGAGEVEAIEVPSSPASKFRVRLRVREDLHPLVRTDSVASIQTEGLVGGTFLFVNAGSNAAPQVPDDGTIAGLQQGKGTVGRLIKDDEIYQRVVDTARQAQGVVEEARKAVQQGREALEALQSKDGPTQGIAADLRETLGHARATLANMEENTQALKRNFFFRGFFKDRGYYELDALSPDEYRRGVLEGDDRQALRIWLRSSVLFAARPDGTEELTADGQARVESAMAGFLRYAQNAPLVVEGYSTAGGTAQQYIRSRARAQLVLDYLTSHFGLASNRTAVMPLGNRAAGSPDGEVWDG